MKKIQLFSIVAALVIFACTKKNSTVGEMTFPEGTVQHVVRAAEIQWRPCPPNLPDGCEMAILEGNPKSDELFTVRFRISGEFIMPAHTHPKEERVTILDGTAYVGFGKEVTKEKARAFGPGDYYVNARNEIHKVWADPGTIIQITGIGPWEANYINQ